MKDKVIMHKSGLFLVAAAVLFWVAWVLMPGVGVTDAKQIFALVAERRPLVAASVFIQLLSAVLYAPALLGIVSHKTPVSISSLRVWIGFLLVGAMGSTADAVLHLLAYAMTEPGLDTETLVRVMAFMQGPGLLLLAPLILAFFLGGGGLSFVFVKARIVSPWNFGLHAIAIAVAVIGGLLATKGLMSSRFVGLSVLGIISAAQAWVGIALWKGGAGQSWSSWR